MSDVRIFLCYGRPRASGRGRGYESSLRALPERDRRYKSSPRALNEPTGRDSILPVGSGEVEEAPRRTKKAYPFLCCRYYRRSDPGGIGSVGPGFFAVFVVLLGFRSQLLADIPNRFLRGQQSLVFRSDP